MHVETDKVKYYVALFEYWLEQQDYEMASHYLQQAIITERGI